MSVARPTCSQPEVKPPFSRGFRRPFALPIPPSSRHHRLSTRRMLVWKSPVLRFVRLMKTHPIQPPFQIPLMASNTR